MIKLLEYKNKILWYIKRPNYYLELFRVLFILSKKLLNVSKNTKRQGTLSKRWCQKKAVDTTSAILQITKQKQITPIETMFKGELSKAKKRKEECLVEMGGPTNINLLYHLTEFIKAKKVIETGVAHGWSSLAILLSLQNRGDSTLISTDKPYPGMNNEAYVGCVVPNKLREKWKIIKSPDRDAVPKAIEILKDIDLCHYDSDKTYEGRSQSYPQLWKALRRGGVFISDDIGDNLAFHDFCKKIKKEPIIVKTESNYVGVIVNLSRTTCHRRVACWTEPRQPSRVCGGF
jgi:predicted O-methyltransferase YrrM